MYMDNNAVEEYSNVIFLRYIMEPL